MHWIALRPLPCADAPADPLPGQDETLRLWSWRALQFTPRVALADGAVVLEIAASERLFGGRRALKQGYDPRGFDPAAKDNEALVQNPGSGRRSGWDCCFVCPKSVSVAFALETPENREILRQTVDLRAKLTH